MSSALSNAELIQGIRMGGSAARVALYQTHATRLKRVLGHMVGSDQDLPDLLQEVFILAFENVGRLDSPPALQAFLNQIAVNVAREHIRRQVRRRALHGVLSRDAIKGRGPLDHLASEARLAVSELLRCLPVVERVPLTLRFMEEMQVDEVAAACGVSAPTVKRRLTAARRRLSALSRSGENKGAEKIDNDVGQKEIT